MRVHYPSTPPLPNSHCSPCEVLTLQIAPTHHRPPGTTPMFDGPVADFPPVTSRPFISRNPPPRETRAYPLAVRLSARVSRARERRGISTMFSFSTLGDTRSRTPLTDLQGSTTPQQNERRCRNGGVETVSSRTFPKTYRLMNKISSSLWSSRAVKIGPGGAMSPVTYGTRTFPAPNVQGHPEAFCHFHHQVLVGV